MLPRPLARARAHLRPPIGSLRNARADLRGHRVDEVSLLLRMSPELALASVFEGPLFGR